MNFDEIIDEHIQRHQGLASRGRGPFIEALEEFAEALQRHYPILTRVERGRLPLLWYFRAAPRYRPDAWTTLLVLRQDEGGLKPLEHDRAVTDREDFEHYLAEFFRSDGFQQTLNTYSELAEEPALGLLRVGSPDRGDPATEFAVTLDASEHRRLVDAAEGEALTLRATAGSPFSDRRRPLPANTTYRYPSAEGVHLRLDATCGVEQGEDGQHLQLKGERLEGPTMPPPPRQL